MKKHSSSPAAVVLVTGLALCSGCGYSQGQMLYFLGIGQGQKVEAEFLLTKDGPVAILVDDFEERLLTPRTRTDLSNQLATQLKQNKAAREVIPAAEMVRLRREHDDFDERGCREVGRLAQAHQVIWLQVRDYLGDPDPEDASSAARMTIAVKVINALEEKDPLAVRLWPAERDGRIVTTDLDAATVVRLKTPRAISGELSAKITEEVARFFYDHRLEE